MEEQTTIYPDSSTHLNLLSYCGFYCGACPKYLKGDRQACKGDSPTCALGFKACKVRPCCIAKGINSCADCDEYSSVKV